MGGEQIEGKTWKYFIRWRTPVTRRHVHRNDGDPSAERVAGASFDYGNDLAVSAPAGGYCPRRTGEPFRGVEGGAPETNSFSTPPATMFSAFGQWPRRPFPVGSGSHRWLVHRDANRFLIIILYRPGPFSSGCTSACFFFYFIFLYIVIYNVYIFISCIFVRACVCVCECAD